MIYTQYTITDVRIYDDLQYFNWPENWQSTFRDTTAGFPRNDAWETSCILMTRHYPDLGSASNWSCCKGNLLQPIRSTTLIWVLTCHQYRISSLVSHTSFRRATSGGVATHTQNAPVELWRKFQTNFIRDTKHNNFYVFAGIALKLESVCPIRPCHSL